jgi:hypothetical protein
MHHPRREQNQGADMNAHRSLAAPLIVVALTACGAGQREAPAPAEQAPLGDMVQTMDRAYGVEDTTLEHKQALDRAMDAADGNP